MSDQEKIDKLKGALVSMVQQYCAVPKEGGHIVYFHDFAAAGEDAFNLLVELGAAKWFIPGVAIDFIPEEK